MSITHPLIQNLRQGIQIYSQQLERLHVLARNSRFPDTTWCMDWMKTSAIIWRYVNVSVVKFIRQIQKHMDMSEYLKRAVSECIARIEAHPWQANDEIFQFYPTTSNLVILPHGVDMMYNGTNVFLIGNTFNQTLIDITKAMFYLDPATDATRASVQEIVWEIKGLSTNVYTLRKNLNLPRPALVQAIFVIMQDFYQIRKAIHLVREETHSIHVSKFPLLEIPLQELKDMIPQTPILDDILSDTQVGYDSPKNLDLRDNKGRLLFEDRIKPSLLELYRTLHFLRNFCKVTL